MGNNVPAAGLEDLLHEDWGVQERPTPTDMGRPQPDADARDDLARAVLERLLVSPKYQQGAHVPGRTWHQQLVADAFQVADAFRHESTRYRKESE